MDTEFGAGGVTTAELIIRFDTRFGADKPVFKDIWEKPMTVFTANNFKNMLETDIWVIKQIQVLPEDPPTEITSEYDEQTGITNHTVKFVTSLSMPAQQEAVKQYRSKLSPIFFAITQKVYAELFRVFLGQNGLSAGDKQVHIQKRIEEVIGNGTIASMIFLPVFLDRTNFDNWWQGEYLYEDLRFARNEVMHDQYEMTSSNHLKVTHNGRLVLDWDNDTVLLFSQIVLAKAQAICDTVSP